MHEKSWFDKKNKGPFIHKNAVKSVNLWRKNKSFNYTKSNSYIVATVSTLQKNSK